MTNPTGTAEYRDEQAIHWQNKYVEQLAQRLETTIRYIQTASRANVRAHIRSFTTSLEEARRYPSLKELRLNLITTLHPLPLRWGFGSLWEAHLRYALAHTPPGEVQDSFQNDLAEIHTFLGNFETSISEAQAVLARPQTSPIQVARAIKMLFTSYRAQGSPEKADRLIQQHAARFAAANPAAKLETEQAQGWLRFNQCRLELLREQGKVEEAFNLVEDMIWLDDRSGNRDAALTADLYTHRSTLLWVRAHYQRSADDLRYAIELYNSVEDIFNAESLKSNLGLVYWTMGEFDHAEKALQSSIQFYRKSGAEQLLTYDIGNMGLVYFARGQLQPAREWTEQHIQHAQKINFISEYNRGCRNLGTLLYYFGEYSRAVAELKTAHAYYKERGSRDAYGLDTVWMALCEYQTGSAAAAITMVEEVLAWSRANQAVVLEGCALRALAYCSPREARAALLQQALTLAQAQQRPMEEAACLLLLAGAMPTEQERRRTWQNAGAMLAAMDASTWLGSAHSIENPPFIAMLF